MALGWFMCETVTMCRPAVAGCECRSRLEAYPLLNREAHLQSHVDVGSPLLDAGLNLDYVEQGWQLLHILIQSRGYIVHGLVATSSATADSHLQGSLLWFAFWTCPLAARLVSLTLPPNHSPTQAPTHTSSLGKSQRHRYASQASVWLQFYFHSDSRSLMHLTEITR